MRISHRRFIVFLAGFALLAGLFWRAKGWALAISLGFDIAAVLYMGWSAIAMRQADADDIRRHAAGNDFGRGALLAIAALITLVILVTVGIELRAASASSDGIALPIATIVIAWVFGNFVYTLHYAHLYYDEADGKDRGGLEFPGDEAPRYPDFAYFAFNLGMAYQVSDVQATSRAMRIVVMIHCAIAFFFNIGVLALAFNIVGSAVSGK